VATERAISFKALSSAWQTMKARTIDFKTRLMGGQKIKNGALFAPTFAAASGRTATAAAGNPEHAWRKG
jgi:hypothetical protein